MSAVQRYLLSSLVVCGVTAIAVVSLLVMTGLPLVAMAGFAVLGAEGFLASRVYRSTGRSALVVVALAGLLTVGIAIFLVVRGLPPLPVVALAGFSLMVIGALAGMCYFRSGDRPVVDERDEAIVRKAGWIGFGVFWLLFVGVSVLTPFVIGFETAIPSGYLPLVPMTGFWIILSARSLAGLVLYGRGS